MFKVLDFIDCVIFLCAEKPPLSGKGSKSSNSNAITNNSVGNGPMHQPPPPGSHEPTWVHSIFQGTLTNETRCLNCETVSGMLFYRLPYQLILYCMVIFD